MISKSVNDKSLREKRSAVAESSSRHNTDTLDQDLSEDSVDEISDEEFNLRNSSASKKAKRSSSVTLSITGKDLAKPTAITAKRYKIGTRAQSDFLTNIFVAGGVDLSTVSCSRSTVRRLDLEAVHETASSIKREFLKQVQGKNLMIYVDGKVVPEFSDGAHQNKKKG